MRAALDSNVWVSGFVARGLCADLLRAALRRHGAGDFELLLPEAVRLEVLRVLREKFRAPNDALAAAQAAMDEARGVGAGSWQAPADFPDPTDAPILAASLAADADFFVTGDAELLALGEVDGLRIVSPRQMYLKLLGTE